jgi:hypothetical protein
VLLACRRGRWGSLPATRTRLLYSALLCWCRACNVCSDRSSLQGLCAVTLGRWACSQWLIISRPRAAHADVSRVAADDRGA